MIKTPCYKCEPPERYSGCHSDCDKFKKYRKNLDAINKKKKEYYNPEVYEYTRELFKGASAR